MFTEFHCFILFQTLDSKELYIKTRKLKILGFLVHGIQFSKCYKEALGQDLSEI